MHWMHIAFICLSFCREWNYNVLNGGCRFSSIHWKYIEIVLALINGVVCNPHQYRLVIVCVFPFFFVQMLRKHHFATRHVCVCLCATFNFRSVVNFSMKLSLCLGLFSFLLSFWHVQVCMSMTEYFISFLFVKKNLNFPSIKLIRFSVEQKEIWFDCFLFNNTTKKTNGNK